MKQKVKEYLIGLYIRFCGRPSKLNKAIKKANKLHKETGQRYRVFFFGYEYKVWNRLDIKRQKRIGLLLQDKKVGADFDTICFYDTNNLCAHVPQS